MLQTPSCLMIFGEILWWTHRMVWQSNHLGRLMLTEIVIGSLWSLPSTWWPLLNLMTWAAFIITIGSFSKRTALKDVGTHKSAHNFCVAFYFMPEYRLLQQLTISRMTNCGSVSDYLQQEHLNFYSKELKTKKVSDW